MKAQTRFDLARTSQLGQKFQETTSKAVLTHWATSDANDNLGAFARRGVENCSEPVMRPHPNRVSGLELPRLELKAVVRMPSHTNTITLTHASVSRDCYWHTHPGRRQIED